MNTIYRPEECDPDRLALSCLVSEQTDLFG